MPPETDQEEVARLVSQYDLLAIPVVTASDEILGVVTIDNVVDVLVQEGATDEAYFSTPNPAHDQTAGRLAADPLPDGGRSPLMCSAGSRRRWSRWWRSPSLSRC